MAQIIAFPAERIAKGVYNYCPEMKQSKPNCQIEAKISYGGKYRLKTKLELKGRGIKFYDTLNDKNIYYATEKAYNKLCEEYSISWEELLD